MTQRNDNEFTEDPQPVSRNIITGQHAHGDNIVRDGNSDEINENCALVNDDMHYQLSKYKNAIKNQSFIVNALSILFGIGSWIGINSTCLQVPLLVDKSPEGWNLPSYIEVIIQIGNIGPLTYTILQKFSPRKVQDSYMIYGVLTLGTIASLLAAFFYKRTTFIAEKEYSLSLFIVVFFFALVGCTSSVLFMPYMGRFKEIYLITYLIGQGLSGLLPSVVALAQGVGGNTECILTNTTEGPKKIPYQPPPRFGTMEFFLFVFVIMICSCIAFTLLDKLKRCKKEYAAVKIKFGNDYEYKKEKCEETDTSTLVENSKQLTPAKYKLVIILMATVSFIGSGIIPSIQSYSCLPYGNIVYHLTVVLTLIANPVACFLAIFLPHTSVRSILTLTGIYSIIAAYTLITAFLSPNPPLLNSWLGQALVILCWIIAVGLVSYIKLCITSVMRSQGGKSLVWTGAVSQAGAAVGSVTIFALINYTKLFTSSDPCS